MKSPTSTPTTLKYERFLIFDTHPIQYRSPVFRSLHERLANSHVYYFAENFNAGHWWFHEVGKIPKQPFGVSLLEGFPSSFLHTDQQSLAKKYRTLRTLLLKEQPTAILIYGYFLPEHWILRLLCKKLRIPLLFVGETFSHYTSGWRKAIKLPLLTYFYNGVSQFVAIGNKTLEYYRQWQVPANRITPAKYCIDTRFFSLPDEAAAKARNELRASMGIPDDAFILLFVGRLFERKRPFDVLEIHKRFSTHPKFHTIMVGNGPMEEELHQKAKGIERFHLVGFKNQIETRNHYFASDLLFVPSEYETWGLVVNEAFACGLPAIVTQTCGVAGDLVIHDSTGFTFPVGNLERAAESIAHGVHHRDKLKAMGENAKRRVTSEYRTDQFSDALVQAFLRATDSRALEPEL